jgi:large subunit ribosomal protein L25
MTDVVTFQAEARDRAGKGGARAVRRSGRIPAIIYGEKREPMMVSLDAVSVLRELKRPGFLSHVCEIALGRTTLRALPRDVQRDPVSDEVLHLDFLRFGAQSRVHVDVAVQFENEDKSPGLKKGVLNVVMRSVEVVCSPDAIPQHLSVDLTGLDIGDVIHAGTLKLPAGVELADADPDATVASIAAPSTGEAAAAEPAAEAEEAAG